MKLKHLRLPRVGFVPGVGQEFYTITLDNQKQAFGVNLRMVRHAISLGQYKLGPDLVEAYSEILKTFHNLADAALRKYIAREVLKFCKKRY
jgi:hypothetical protein